MQFQTHPCFARMGHPELQNRSKPGAPGALVSGLGYAACGATNPGSFTWGAVFYPRNQQEAQFAAGVTNGTITDTLVQYLGEGLGNAAAHEIGHLLVNQYTSSGKIVNGMDMDDPSQDTYNGEACSGSSGSWEFTGAYQGTAIHWSNNATQSLANVLGKRK